MPKPVRLGPYSFPSRKAAIAHFREMLNRYRPEDIVDDDDAAQLRLLLARHPEAHEKLGVGIDHFEVMSAEFGTQCFAVVQLNGSRIDFSYLTCVNQTDQN